MLIEQTKTQPQETLDFKINKQLQTFSFSPSIALVNEGKWLLAVTYFQSMNSIFNKTNENNSLSITMPGHWNFKSAEKTINETNKYLRLRYQNDFELHVE